MLRVRPADAPALWESWRRVADATGLRLWVNCETFERTKFGNRNPLVAASFPRLLLQLGPATPFVDKILTWEAPYFLRQDGAMGGAFGPAPSVGKDPAATRDGSRGGNK